MPDNSPFRRFSGEFVMMIATSALDEFLAQAEARLVAAGRPLLVMC
jgi:hypothetical protein